MATSSKRLSDIMSEITMICVDSQNLKNRAGLEKKMEYYTKGNLLIDEATQLLTKLENDIARLDTTNADISQINRVNDLIDMLSEKNPRFDEVLYIVEQLRAISAGLPATMEFVDNIEKEIIYDETE